MPYGGNDWLALTPEAALEPDLPICDPHHHFWDYREARIPYQRYLLHELADDINGGHNVRSTVFVEARSMYRIEGPDEMKPVGEVEFVQGLAAASATGLYGPGRAAAAIVGHANLNLGDGVKPVLEALHIGASVVINLPMRDAIDEAAVRVREGGAIGRALAVSRLFPPMSIHLISSGEASGKLDDMLERAAAHQESEMNSLISTLLGIMEPALIVFMGVVVLLIVMAILLPIFQINQLIT